MSFLADLMIALGITTLLSDSSEEEPKEIKKINADINEQELTDKEYYNAFVEAFCHDQYCRILREKKELGYSLSCQEEGYLKKSKTIEYVYPDLPDGSDFINLRTKELEMDGPSLTWSGRLRTQEERDNPMLYFRNQVKPIWFKLTSENREDLNNLVEWQDELNRLEEEKREDEWY